MRSWVLRAAILAVGGMPITAEARRMGAYDYPFVSPLVATVAATPPANQAALPGEAEMRAVGRTRYVTVFPERRPPEIYWFLDRGLPYQLYAQPDPRAPLFFLIGGTGAGHDSAKSLVMARVLYQAGFHVVSLPNPTHPSFIVTASRTSVPGVLADDAADLYRVMDLIDRQLQAAEALVAQQGEPAGEGIQRAQFQLAALGTGAKGGQGQAGGGHSAQDGTALERGHDATSERRCCAGSKPVREGALTSVAAGCASPRTVPRCGRICSGPRGRAYGIRSQTQPCCGRLPARARDARLGGKRAEEATG